MDSFDEKSIGSQVFTIMGDNMSIMAGFLVLMVMVANVMGKDFMDKTLNYEILSAVLLFLLHRFELHGNWLF